MRSLRRMLAAGATVALVLGLALLAGRGGASNARHLTPEPFAISAHEIRHFRRGDAATVRFGPLVFLGGLELIGQHANFGGVSAFRFRDGGERFLAVTDTGDWIEGRVTYRDGRPSGIANAVIGPVLGPSGIRAKDLGLWDAESIAIEGDSVWVGIERDHTLLAFDWREAGMRAAGRRVPLPGFVANWPENRGIEALGVFPPGTPHAGRLVGLSERSHGRDDPTEGFVMNIDGSQAFRFRLVRSDGFDITALDFLPNGDMLVAERYFTPLRGVGFRLRRMKPADIAPDATVQADTLLTADADFQIDNIEAMSVHRDASGQTIVTLISDNNFSIVQRTLLLQFRWAEAE